MTCTDVGGGTLVDGTIYDDLKFHNTTVPTSLIFQFGIVPNILPPPSLTTSGPNFLSWLDGQPQAYFADGIGASPVTLTKTMTPSAEITESVVASWVSTAADDYTFTFEIEHIFRVDFHLAGWLSYLINNTPPPAFILPMSMRYICQYKFGTDSTDPNEYRVFNDNVTNGSLGYIDKSFSNGTGIYSCLSVAYENPAAVALASLEATVVNTVTVQLKKTGSNFPAGQEIILYVAKLPTETEYSNNGDTWEVNRVFAQATAVEGGALVDVDFIKDVFVLLNADPTKLDIMFDIDYSTAQKAAIANGDRYGIFMSVGDQTLSAALADGKTVWVDVNQYTKNSDISGNILSHRIGCFTAEKTPNSGGSDNSDFKLWNDRIELFFATFNLHKVVGQTHSVEKIVAKLVTYDATTEVEGVIDEINLPLSSIFSIADAFVFDCSYQIVNVTGYRDFNINPTAIAKQYTVKAKPPGSFGDQVWQLTFPLRMKDDTTLFNPTIPYTPFFDDTKPNNNLNFKTSNYSAVANFGIYCKIEVTVFNQGVNTTYEIYSEKSVVRDYDVNTGANVFVGVHKIYDENNILIPYFNGKQNRIETTYSEPGISALTTAFLVAEHTVVRSDRSAPGYSLHSSKDWGYSGNALEPLDGQTYVKITHDVAGDKIIVESLVKEGALDPTKNWDIISHLYENR